MIDTKWTDPDGNIKPNSNQTDSENPTTFNATYFFLKEMAGEMKMGDYALCGYLNEQKWLTNKGVLMTNSFDVENIGKDGHHDPDSFSLDESIAYAAMCRRFGQKENMTKLKIVTSNTWYRFYDVIPFLLLAKYPLLNILFPLRMLVSLSMIVACMQERFDTSGKQLAFIRYRGLSMGITWWICMKVLTNPTPMEIFQIYFPEREHVINQLARKIWRRK